MSSIPSMVRRLRPLACIIALFLVLSATDAAAQNLSPATERLFEAVSNNDLSLVQAAIGAGADLEARNVFGITPADLAVDKGHFEIAHFLLNSRRFQDREALRAAQAELQRRQEEAAKPPTELIIEPLSQEQTPPPPPPSALAGPNPFALDYVPAEASLADRAERLEAEQQQREFEAARLAEKQRIAREAEQARQQAQAAERKRREAERLAKAKAEAEAKARAEAEAAAKAEAERLAKEKARADSERLAEEARLKAEAEAKARAEAETARVATEQAETKVKANPKTQDVQLVAEEAEAAEAATAEAPADARVATETAVTTHPQSEGGSLGRFFGRVGDLFGRNEVDAAEQGTQVALDLPPKPNPTAATVQAPSPEAQAIARLPNVPVDTAVAEAKPEPVNTDRSALETLSQAEEQLALAENIEAETQAQTEARMKAEAEAEAKAYAEAEAAAKAEAERLAEEEARAEAARKAVKEARIAEEARLQAEAEEAQRLAEEAERERARRAEEDRLRLAAEAETKRLTQEAEAKRLRLEQEALALKQAEEARKAAEAEAVKARAALAQMQLEQQSDVPPEKMAEEVSRTVVMEAPSQTPAPPTPRKPIADDDGKTDENGFFSNLVDGISDTLGLSGESASATLDVPKAGGPATGDGTARVVETNQSVTVTAAAPGGNAEDWAVQEVKKTNTPIVMDDPVSRQAAALPAEPQLRKEQPSYLKNEVLTMARFSELGGAIPKNAIFEGVDRNCLRKKRETITFCVEEVEWPSSLDAALKVSTVLYSGQKAIVRYDSDRATRMHAVFPSTSFDAIANYYRKRFGQPTEDWRRTIAPMGKPRQENPTLVWRSMDSETRLVTSLEIRKFDDTRGGFPDEKRGAVMLYNAWSEPIFPQVSELELMSLKERGVR